MRRLISEEFADRRLIENRRIANALERIADALEKRNKEEY